MRRFSVGGCRQMRSRERTGEPWSLRTTPGGEGTHYEEKEVTVYFKTDEDRLILLTAIARYGSDFSRHPHES